jgi:hypothetical protein
MKLSLLAITGAAAIALSATAPAPVQAGAIHLTPTFGSHVQESDVIEVRRHRRRSSRNRDWLALGIGSAIVGGMIASQRPAYGYGYGPGPGYHGSSAWDACAARFRSLEPDGFYTTFDGRRVLCPYLR